MTINELKQAIANEKPRSAWGRGVKGYAEGLAEELEERDYIRERQQGRNRIKESVGNIKVENQYN